MSLAAGHPPPPAPYGTNTRPRMGNVSSTPPCSVPHCGSPADPKSSTGRCRLVNCGPKPPPECKVKTCRDKAAPGGDGSCGLSTCAVAQCKGSKCSNLADPDSAARYCRLPTCQARDRIRICRYSSCRNDAQTNHNSCGKSSCPKK